MSYAAPYADIKILDLSQGFAGPYCIALFSLYGAQVTTVEPIEGDWIRGIGRSYAGQTPLSLVANPHKRSVAVNLKSEEGREIVYKLAEDADVAMESFRPGVADRLGVGFEDLRKVNPKIIYGSVSGFGQSGPYRERPGSDTVLRSFSGLCAVNKGNDGVPHRVGMLVPDTITGVYAHQAIAAALAGRDEESEGVHLDLSLAHCMAALLAPKIIERYLEGGEPRILNAPAGSYETADGFVGIALVKEEQYRRICEAMDMPELADDPRFTDFELRAKNFDLLKPLMEVRFRERTTDEWCATFREHDILADRINDFDDWLDDEHVKATGLAPHSGQPGIGSFPFPTVPGTTPRDAEKGKPFPDIGEHGRHVLAGLGYDDQAMQALVEAGAVALPE